MEEWKGGRMEGGKEARMEEWGTGTIYQNVYYWRMYCKK